jgi:hypothetical protein
MAIPVFKSACFFSTDNGVTVQKRSSANDEKFNPLPSGVTNLFRFDESQVNNQGLLTQWATNASAFTMAGSQVLVSGNPATFDTPSLAYVALQNAEAMWSKANSTGDAFTREEQAYIMALAFRALGFV